MISQEQPEPTVERELSVRIQDINGDVNSSKSSESKMELQYFEDGYKVDTIYYGVQGDEPLKGYQEIRIKIDNIDKVDFAVSARKKIS